MTEIRVGLEFICSLIESLNELGALFPPLEVNDFIGFTYMQGRSRCGQFGVGCGQSIKILGINVFLSTHHDIAEMVFLCSLGTRPASRIKSTCTSLLSQYQAGFFYCWEGRVGRVGGGRKGDSFQPLGEGEAM